MGVWNDLLVALLFMPQASHETLNVVLATLGTRLTFPIGDLLAGATLSMIPSVVVYLVFQRRLVNGFTIGLGT
jgi:ABC-type glycerol-3-phosphate transport system permease component